MVRGGVSLIAIGESHLEAAALVLVDMTPQMEAEGARRIQAFMNQKPEGFDTLQEVADAMDRADTGGPLCAIRGYDGSLAAGTLALIHCQHLLRRAEQARG